MTTDAELLQRYVDARSQAAFTELVHRHVGLVYSVAQRRVGGDAHLAQDVAQQVFFDLARKAGSLTGRATLAGWLYSAAHVASAAVVRSEQRRKTREVEAHAMQTISSSEPAQLDTAELRLVIEDAIVVLKEEEREAIVLRFFQARSFAQIGAALRVSEEAARKRVDRALDKLRGALTARGVTSTPTALAATLGGFGISAAPVELSQHVVQHALAGANAATGASGWSGLLTAGWSAAALVLIGGFSIAMQRQANERLRVEVAELTTAADRASVVAQHNPRLAQNVSQVDELRRLAAELPALRSTLPRPTERASAPAKLTVTPRGTITWGDEPVNLREFITRARALGNQPGGAAIVIRAVGAEFSPVAYVIDEVRKAGINAVVVESDATPDAKLGFSWF